MHKKSKAFLKNCGITSAIFLAAGYGGADLANQFTDSEYWITAISTAAPYIVGFPIFGLLHAQSNPDLYRDSENSFRWWPFVKDLCKMVTVLWPLDMAYVSARPVIQYQLLEHGVDPGVSAIITDATLCTAYCFAAWPLAKAWGLLREEQTTIENTLST